MSKYILKSGGIVSSKGVFFSDILIENGKITKIADNICETAVEINCEGKLILPGIVDVHVHFREPGHEYKEDFYSGSKSALSGGVTTVFDMPNNQPPIVSVDDLEKKRELIRGRSFVNYGLYMGFNGTNFDEINRATNIPAVKFYACDSTGNMGTREGVHELFENCNKFIVVHSEDGEIIEKNKLKFQNEVKLEHFMHSEIRSVEAAVSSTEKICELAKATGHSVHIAHLSTARELQLVNEYRQYGLTCEVAPHHLFFCTDDYEHLGAKIRMNPPVRDRENVFALWKGIKAGEVDMFATDHAPHTLDEKLADDFYSVPSGVPGIEMLLPLLLNAVNNEGLTIEEVVRLCCENPTKIFAVKNKGYIKEGYDADIVVVDMEEERLFENNDVVSKCGWSPYSGTRYKGWPTKVFVNGVLCFDKGVFSDEPVGEEVSFS